jgi:hypothetical protein
MKVAIMQPYFFPYIGYFQLIRLVDYFILFDDVQYIRHGWINRNRILKPDKGWQYIIAPLQSHSQLSLIKDIKVNESNDWRNKILRQIEHYKKKAPFYLVTKLIVEECLNCNDFSITHLNAFIIKRICNYLELPINLTISSLENYNYSKVNDAGDWALEICEQLGAKSYLNPSSGIDIFNLNKFKSRNIDISFVKSTNISYSQRRDGVIEGGLSIIDVLMFNSPEEIHELLYKCEIINRP